MPEEIIDRPLLQPLRAFLGRVMLLFKHMHRFAPWDIPRNPSLRFAHEESAQTFLSYRTTMAKEMVLPSFVREDSIW
jgi:hypothetical protein